MLPLLAVSTLEKVQKVSPQFWLKVALFIAGLIVAILLIRWALRMNKMILGVIVFITVGLVGFQWIYERNEPAVMTPFVGWVAQFFPGKGSYEAGQQQEPTKPGVKKNVSPAAPPRASAPAKK